MWKVTLYNNVIYLLTRIVMLNAGLIESEQVLNLVWPIDHFPINMIWLTCSIAAHRHLHYWVEIDDSTLNIRIMTYGKYVLFFLFYGNVLCRLIRMFWIYFREYGLGYHESIILRFVCILTTDLSWYEETWHTISVRVEIVQMESLKFHLYVQYSTVLTYDLQVQCRQALGLNVSMTIIITGMIIKSHCWLVDWCKLFDYFVCRSFQVMPIQRV